MKKRIAKSLFILFNPIMFLSFSAFNGNKKHFIILIGIIELSFGGMIAICINELLKKGFNNWFMVFFILYFLAMIVLVPVFLKKQIKKS